MGSQIKTQQKVMGHKWSSNADDGWWNTDAAMCQHWRVPCQHWRPGCSAPTDMVVRGHSDTGERSLLA